MKIINKICLIFVITVGFASGFILDFEYKEKQISKTLTFERVEDISNMNIGFERSFE